MIGMRVGIHKENKKGTDRYQTPTNKTIPQINIVLMKIKYK